MPFEGGFVPFGRGTVGIASTGEQVGGDSQLFVVKRNADNLYNKYAVLGLVTKGMDTVDAVKRGDRIASMRMLR
jgi:peptidylprolyl isomerase